MDIGTIHSEKYNILQALLYNHMMFEQGQHHLHNCTADSSTHHLIVTLSPCIRVDSRHWWHHEQKKCFSVLRMHGCLQFCLSLTVCTVVSPSGTIHVLFCCFCLFDLFQVFNSDVALRRLYCEACGKSVTEPLCMWNRLTVWAWPQCSVVKQKNGCWLSPLVMISIWCCLCGYNRSQGVNEPGKSPLMILAESVEDDLRSLTFKDLWEFPVERDLCGAQRFSEEDRSY